ncbi:hypothetical protein Emag_006072 [Eimeria magna]
MRPQQQQQQPHTCNRRDGAAAAAAPAAAAPAAAFVLLAALPFFLICASPQLKTVQRDLEEKRKWRDLMGAELDRQFRELQQQEAADARVLQQQLQQLQQQQQQQQQLQKQITMQKDVEILDTEQSIKELKSRSERVYEEFLSLVKDVVSQMHERLCVPETTGQRSLEAFNTQIESIKKDMIANIEAFFAVKKESQTLGGAWRGLGLVPPSAVTQLGV